MFRSLRASGADAILLAMFSWSGIAHAGLVSVTGGVTHYSGPTWHYAYPTVTVSTLLQAAGDLPRAVPLLAPLPDDPINLYGDAGIGLGQLSLTYGGFLPPTPTVEFWQSFDGDKDRVNAISFAPAAPQNVMFDEEFLLGTFTFTNGAWFGSVPLGSGPDYQYPESAFQFELVTQSTDPALNGHRFSGSLRLHVTGTSDPDPAADADYFYFFGHPELGYVGVYESYNTPTGSNSGSIEFYGRIGSLVPTRFANPDGLVLASELPVTPVPLPPAAVLLAAGLWFAHVFGSRVRPRSG